ncbi:TPA: acyltransferase, partial [Enterobacter hormaechei subsp. steigerwaltii]|nr:acyltransferase [Enterobacter hormaechei subsp. steigerwaltii]
MKHKINYRPELDGLRTIAVLAVLIYHAKLSFNGAFLLPGGFLGVDVFFVLSGYLISSIILNSEASNNFSFWDFYNSRAKRIFPALFAMLIVASYAAYGILLPDAFLIYGKTLIASALFVSNVYFFGEDAYVSESSDLKPLLHTWSLSVEWQFYLIFPAILFLMLKLFKKRVVWIVFLMWFISFAVSVYQAKYNINAAFYLLPSRSWELLSGCLVAIIGRRNN